MKSNLERGGQAKNVKPVKNMDYINVEMRKIPVVATVDVFVAGGGCAGVCPNPQGIASRDVTRSTDSTFLLVAALSPTAQEEVTAGNALIPKDMVRAGTRLNSVMA